MISAVTEGLIFWSSWEVKDILISAEAWWRGELRNTSHPNQEKAEQRQRESFACPLYSKCT